MGDTSLLYTIFAIDKASSVNEKVGGSINKLALGIGVAGAAIAVKTTMMAANFQQSMTKIQTSAGESAGNIKSDSAGILAMAGQVGDSAMELSSALYTINSGGQHGAAGLIVLRAAAEGAKAEGADLTTVSDALTSVLQDYHLKASDAALVTSKLVAATGAGKQTFEQLAGSLSSVLPVASAAHISLNDILAAEASMTVHGMSADQVTQNLADTIRHMQNPTQVQSKELGQLGIKASDLSGMLGTKGLTGTLSFVSQTILSKMGPSGKVLLGTFTQSQQAAENVKQMIAGMPKPLQDLANSFIQGKMTAKDWTQTLQTLTPEQAHQMQQFATLQKSATGFTQALATGSPAAQSYSAALAKAMGDSTGLNTALMLTGENSAYVNGAIKQISGATTEAGNHVAGWGTIQKNFNQKLAEAKDTVEALGIKIGTVLLPYASDAVAVTMSAVTWFTKHKTVAQDLAIAVGSLAAAILLYKTYMLAATAVEKIQLGYLAAKKVAMLGVTAAQWAWNLAQTAANSSLWTWIAVQAIDFAGWVRQAVATGASTVALWAYNAATLAVKIGTIAWTAVQWALNAAFIASPIGWIVLGIGALVAVIVLIATKTNWFQDVWRATWSFLKTIGAWFSGPFSGFFVSAYHKVTDAITSAVWWIHGKVTEAKQILSTIWDTLKSGVVTAVTWVHTKIDFLVTTVKAMPGRITAGAAGMFDGLKDSFKSAVNWMIGKWNDFHLTLGGGSVMGVKIPSVTLNTPDIPMLAHGGTAYSGGAVVVGDRGPETLWMPAGAGITPDGGRGARAAAGGGGSDRPIVVCVHLAGSTKAIVKEISAYVRDNYSGNVTVALSGHAT